MGNAGQTNYSASKAGLSDSQRAWPERSPARGITVNAVGSGVHPHGDDLFPAGQSEGSFYATNPMGRIGEPEDVAEAVHWLCSERSRYVTGQVIHVNGGLYM